MGTGSRGQAETAQDEKECCRRQGPGQTVFSGDPRKVRYAPALTTDQKVGGSIPLRARENALVIGFVTWASPRFGPLLAIRWQSRRVATLREVPCEGTCSSAAATPGG